MEDETSFSYEGSGEVVKAVVSLEADLGEELREVTVETVEADETL